MSDGRDDDCVVFITLGDGDFTWSLDLARYLAHNSKLSNDSNNSVEPWNRRWPQRRLRLIATGIDALSELTSKYRNAAFVFREWQRVHSEEAARVENQDKTDRSNPPVVRDNCHDLDDTLLKSASFCLEMKHEINAIVGQHPAGSSSDSCCIPKGHVVVFNHPHLGCEDAVRHAQFLCHLFHSVANHWLIHPTNSSTTNTDGGVFYLTLVKGQFERWECLKAAGRHGMVLQQRLTFVPAPSSPAFEKLKKKDGNQNQQAMVHHYEHRRHQTGKSFASRCADGSETFVFVHDNLVANNSGINGEKSLSPPLPRLPWFVEQNDGSTESNVDAMNDQTGTKASTIASPFVSLATAAGKPFSCDKCDKSFREERSLVNHIKSKHVGAAIPVAAATACSTEAPTGDERKRKRSAANNPDPVSVAANSTELHKCPYCGITDGNKSQSTRTFDSLQALQDHMTAKHSAIHATLSHSPQELPQLNEEYRPLLDTISSSSSSTVGAHGMCDICGYVYVDAADHERHVSAFVPSKSAASAEWQCQFCSKSFRQPRALAQHENFCSVRRDTSKLEVASN